MYGVDGEYDCSRKVKERLRRMWKDFKRAKEENETDG